MFAFVLVAATAPTGDVSLEDTRTFGVSPEAARAIWILASRHERAFEATIDNPWVNEPETVTAWRSECRWRASVWYAVDDVMYHEKTDAGRLRALGRLKELIGESAYYAGQLPNPTPTYRGLTRP